MIFPRTFLFTSIISCSTLSYINRVVPFVYLSSYTYRWLSIRPYLVTAPFKPQRRPPVDPTTSFWFAAGRRIKVACRFPLLSFISHLVEVHSNFSALFLYFIGRFGLFRHFVVFWLLILVCLGLARCLGESQSLFWLVLQYSYNFCHFPCAPALPGCFEW